MHRMLLRVLPLFLTPAWLFAASEGEVDLLFGVKIPLRDGVRLNATVLKPRGAGPLPVIATLTPYIADTYLARAMYFARHGYVFALVDVRGRGNSEGEFVPFENESRDGADAVEWFAKQGFSSGSVALWGGSYAGFDQWATAREHPPHLRTIVPAAAAAAGVDFPFWNNISYPYIEQWATYTSLRTPNLNLFLDQVFWISKYQELFRKHMAFRELDTLAGNPSGWFHKTLEHPFPDAYWKSMRPTEAEYAALDMPILTITGDYDDDQPGALHYYAMHMKYGKPEVAKRHYLLIGPWDHAGTRTPRLETGGVTFGKESLVDLNALHAQWYDYAMKSGAKPAFLKDRVGYYVVGADEWKWAGSLEGIGAVPERLLLGSSPGGGASDATHSGLLGAASPTGADTYTYDPLDLRPADLEATEIQAPYTDERYALNLFGSGLVYTGEPFPDATEVTGFVHLTAYMALDVRDTDFQALLYEVLPSGGSVLLTTDLQRARYRESVEKPALVRPGEVLRYDFSGFTFFSRRVSKGSRLRLVLRSPNSIFMQKNYNSGGAVAEETGKDARTAHVRVVHDREHPSALVLPVVRPSATTPGGSSGRAGS